MHKLFFGILISVLAILALLVGLGLLLTRILPLTAVPSRHLGDGRQCRYVSLADYDRLLHSHHALSSTLGGG